MTLIETHSGIRGIYGDSLDESLVHRYGHSFLEAMNLDKNSTVVIGHDTRKYNNKLKEVLLKLPCNIIDIGVASTPLIQNAVRHFNASGGFMLTASHNEPEWHGIKFLDNSGAQIEPEHAKKVIEIKKLGKNVNISNNVSLLDKRKEAYRAYRNFIFSHLGKEGVEKIKEKNFKIAIDPNGGAAVELLHIFDELSIETIKLHHELGKFGRIIEPKPETLTKLKEIVGKENVEFGIGFDCDADRGEFITSNGLSNGDNILAVCIDNFLSEIENKESEFVVVNEQTSYVTKKVTEKHRAKFVEVPVGENYVVKKMKELNSKIGGEGTSSGVIMAPSRCRDGLLGALHILKFIAITGKNLNTMLEELPEYHFIDDKFPLASISLNEMINKLKKYYSGRDFIVKDVPNGLKVWPNRDSFVMLRGSNTEPIVRIRSDSPSKSKTEKLFNELKSLLR
ncbi:MAG: hypothetical protein AABW46_03255 [Nanoarchaeota archaeon]